MTLAKNSYHRSSSLRCPSKTGAKRAVSFSSSCKFSAPSRNASDCPNSDTGLQSIDKRRRYMRRGSKSPSMLMMSCEQRQKLLEDVDTSGSEFVEQHKQRRLSLMSALKVNLEKASIIEPAVAREIRRMSTDQQRNLTYELLSKV